MLVSIISFHFVLTLLFQALSDFPDLHHNKAIDIATPKCHFAILRRLYYHSRYEIVHSQPAIMHKNNNSLLLLALDHEAHGPSGGGGCGHNTAERVVLKFTKNKRLFMRELEIRSEVDLSPDYVVPIVETYNGTTTSLCVKYTTAHNAALNK